MSDAEKEKDKGFTVIREGLKFPIKLTCPECGDVWEIPSLPRYVECDCDAFWYLPGVNDAGEPRIERDHPHDTLTQGPDAQARADRMGEQLVAIMMSQQEARGPTSEMYRRYRRDCELLKVDAMPIPLLLIGPSPGAIAVPLGERNLRILIRLLHRQKRRDEKRLDKRREEGRAFTPEEGKRDVNTYKVREATRLVTRLEFALHKLTFGGRRPRGT